MKYARIVLRLLLGLPLVGFGMIGILTVMPDPQAAWEDQDGFAPKAKELILAMWDSGYLMHSVAVTHVGAGLLIMINRFVPLALAVHLPVSIQMALFHLFLDPATGLFAFLILALNIVLIIFYRDSYKELLRPTVRFRSDDSQPDKMNVKH